MVIFTARQNLANLNEVKMNLIVKFANLAGKSYIQVMHIKEVISKNYSPRGNFIKVSNTQG